MIHTARGRFSTAAETSSGVTNDDAGSFADTEGTVLQDIEVGM